MNNLNTTSYSDTDNSVKITIENLNVFYDKFQALKNINLNITNKQITAFIGPSGCGKSTCLKTINRMNDLVKNCKITGKILIDNENIFDSKTNITLLRKKAGMVFQHPNPFKMSVLDNVTYGPKIHGIKNKNQLLEIAEKSLKKAALWDELKDKLKTCALTLSGGQQQRLCIARTLAIEPEILLMDEPTSALDPVSTLKIEDLMAELKQNYTLIVVTHNMRQAARIADKTAFFLKGELIEFGKTIDMFQKPKNEKTENYITGRFC